MDSYFSDDFRLSAKREVMEEDEEELLPTKILTVDITDEFTAVSDNLSVKYTGLGLQDGDAGIVQADIPAPVKCIAYYFEAYIKNAGERGEIAIGFSREHIKSEGYHVKNCAYTGHTGLIRSQNGEVETVVTTNTTYTTDDTVGCGIDYVSQTIFFTKNGALVGTIPRNFRHPLYPTIALHSQNEEYMFFSFSLLLMPP